MIQQTQTTKPIERYSCEIDSEIISHPSNPRYLFTTNTCHLECHCQSCSQLRYTKSLVLQEEEFQVFRAPLMFRQPVSNHFQMLGLVTLNFKYFYKHPIKQICKLKTTYLDCPPGLIKLFLTIRPDQHRQQFIINASDLSLWFVHLVRTKLYNNSKIGVPFRKKQTQGKVLGKLCIRSGGEWKKKGVVIISDRLKIQGENYIKKIKEFWTRFQLIDVQGLCLVVKFWDFLTKWEIGIPLAEVSVWLMAFLSLVRD